MARRKLVRRRLGRVCGRWSIACKVCNLALAKGVQRHGDAGGWLEVLLHGLDAHHTVCPGKNPHYRIDLDTVGGRRHG